MEKMVAFVKDYFPVFVLGAVFGKVIELSGFSKSIVAATVRIVGPHRSILAIVLVCALLTYGGVSLFVVVFAVYPFAAEMFRHANIPKRLIPGTIALGAFSFTMDALPGSPQIQNIIPTTFFNTDTWAAPWLGTIGGFSVFAGGVAYLDWRRRRALRTGEGYGTGHSHEPHAVPAEGLANPWIAIVPLIVVAVLNIVFTRLIQKHYGQTSSMQLPGMGDAITVKMSKLAAIWAVEGALLMGIFTVLIFSFRRVSSRFAEGSKSAVAGAMLACMNTAAEYGFGAVIAVLPGFLAIRDRLKTISNPLVNEALTVTTLSGITGSASGGMSIALAAMSAQFIAAANAHHIPMEVLHRVAAMASGGMDTLPHNGAVITLLAVCGLTHRQSYRDIFAVTCIKTMAVFVVIGVYYLTGFR
jgi:H+/gluconate symporter-like permease